MNSKARIADWGAPARAYRRMKMAKVSIETGDEVLSVRRWGISKDQADAKCLALARRSMMLLKRVGVG